MVLSLLSTMSLWLRCTQQWIVISDQTKSETTLVGFAWSVFWWKKEHPLQITAFEGQCSVWRWCVNTLVALSHLPSCHCAPEMPITGWSFLIKPNMRQLLWALNDVLMRKKGHPFWLTALGKSLKVWKGCRITLVAPSCLPAFMALCYKTAKQQWIRGNFWSSQIWDACWNLWMVCLGGRKATHCDSQPFVESRSVWKRCGNTLPV